MQVAPHKKLRARYQRVTKCRERKIGGSVHQRKHSCMHSRIYRTKGVVFLWRMSSSTHSRLIMRVRRAQTFSFYEVLVAGFL